MKARVWTAVRRCLPTLAAISWSLLATAQDVSLDAGPGDELVSLRNARNALVAASDFTAALMPAERSLELALARSDPDEYIDRMHLARIQAELGQFEAAENQYLAVIDSITARDGQSSLELLEPYQGLGRSYINSRRFVEAITVLEEARAISQRNTGLFNVEQSALIDDITLAHLGIGDTLEARRLQLERLENAVRRFGAEDPAVVPYYRHLGDYYDNSRLRESAREQYEKALAIQERGDASESELLDSLRKLVQIELMLGDDDTAKLRLEEIINNDPPADPVARGLSLALLADWALVHEDLETSRAYYGRAYAALEEANEIQAAEYFAKPAMIDFVPPLSSVDRGRRSDPYAWGSIVLSLDVTAEGRASNVTTLQLDPPSDAGDAFVRRVRETHFRPGLSEGVPVATSDVELTHFFRYYVRERRRR